MSVVVGGVLGLVNGVLIAYGRVHPIIITFGTRTSSSSSACRSSARHGQRHPRHLRRVRPRGRRQHPRRPERLRDHPARRRAPPGGTCGTPRAAGTSTPSAVTRTPPDLAGVKVRQRRGGGVRLSPARWSGSARSSSIAKGTSTLDQSVGSGKELAVIAAVVIGGTSIVGGRGSVLGTMLGALLVQTVTSGVTQLGWPSQLSGLFVGVFIIIAVGTDLLRERARRTSMTTVTADDHSDAPRRSRSSRDSGASARAACVGAADPADRAARGADRRRRRLRSSSSPPAATSPPPTTPTTCRPVPDRRRSRWRCSALAELLVILSRPRRHRPLGRRDRLARRA